MILVESVECFSFASASGELYIVLVAAGDTLLPVEVHSIRNCTICLFQRETFSKTYIHLLHSNATICVHIFTDSTGTFHFVSTWAKVSRARRTGRAGYSLRSITASRTDRALDSSRTIEASVALRTNGALRSIDAWSARKAWQAPWPNWTSHCTDVADLAIRK